MAETWGAKADHKTAVITPGELLRRKIALAGVNASALAKQLEIHVQTIYNVTTGNRPISANLALKLSRRFVEPVDVWMAKKVEITIDSDDVLLTAKRARSKGDVDAITGTPLFADYTENVDGILVDREIKALLANPNSGVEIAPYQSRNVQPASYDLTVGLIIPKGFRVLSEYDWGLVLRETHESDAGQNRELQRIHQQIANAPDSIKYSTEIRLERGDSAVVMARETVAFRGNYLAEVGSTSAHAREGLLVNHGFQIDPGFRGAIFVTVMNIGIEPFTLREGSKLVSLAIRRLARAPDCAYRDETRQAISDITHRVYGAIRKLYHCRELFDDEFQAETDRFDLPAIGDSADDALDRAVSSVILVLEEPDDDDPDHDKILDEVRRLTKEVTVMREEAEALVNFLGVEDRALKDKALKFFRHKGDKQTLGAMLERLSTDPLNALRKMLDLQPLSNSE